MARNKIIAGIDIGTSKTCTVIGKISEEEDKINIIGAASIPSRGIRKGQIVNIEEAVTSITESVEAAERMAGYSLSSAFISVGGAHLTSQNSHGVVAVAEPEGEITADDVDRVVEAARAISLPGSREILHVIPREFVVDSQEGIKDPIGMTGVRLEVKTHIITGSSTAMRNLAKCVGEVGIDIEALVASAVASAETTLTDTEKELGVILVDIGGGTTDIAVFIEGALAHTAVLPVGGRNVTNDLAIGLRLSLDAAEKIKIALFSQKDTQLQEKTRTKTKEKDSKKSDDEINLEKLGIVDDKKTVSKKTLIEGIIKPRLNEIFTMIGLELKKNQLAGLTPAGVVVCGGAAQTIGLTRACKSTLSMPVRIGSPKKIIGLIDDVKSPAFATTTGLLVFGRQAEGGIRERVGLKKISQIANKIPIKGLATKVSDLLKSFLP